MKSIAQNKEIIKRYLPHELSTKVHAVETYRQTGDVRYIYRKYTCVCIKKASFVVIRQDSKTRDREIESRLIYKGQVKDIKCSDKKISLTNGYT